jgi:hypothetical protein
MNNIIDQPPAMNPLSFIDRVIAEIELTPTQYAQAERSYKAVAEVLRKTGSPILLFDPSIHPQGSMRIGTTIKPRGRDEFDLDMLCWLAASGKQYTPNEVYEWVWRTLYADGTYRPMLERKCRCIRINYNDGFSFHLDVTPAIPDWDSHSSSLYVPDRTRKTWCSTHPLGFADSFFKPIAGRMPVIVRGLTANSREFSAKTATVEPLPAHGQFDKTPLQRVVQMVKHDRDRYYEDKRALMPSSILLTTLATHSYNAAVDNAALSMFAFVERVVAGMPSHIVRSHTESRTTYLVENPVNRGENFAERWTDREHTEFMRWHSQLMGSLRALEQTRGKGVDVMLHELSTRYGEDRVKRAANSLGVDTRRLHEAGKLRADHATGAIGAIGSSVAPTINYGSED